MIGMPRGFLRRSLDTTDHLRLLVCQARLRKSGWKKYRVNFLECACQPEIATYNAPSLQGTPGKSQFPSGTEAV